jgi:hypothetical protein
MSTNGLFSKILHMIDISIVNIMGYDLTKFEFIWPVFSPVKVLSWKVNFKFLIVCLDASRKSFQVAIVFGFFWKFEYLNTILI